MHGEKSYKPATLKSSASFNIQWLREEHDGALNSSKGNGTTENIEELDKLRQILEDKKGDDIGIGEDQYILRGKL